MKLEYHSLKLRLNQEQKKNCRIVITSCVWKPLDCSDTLSIPHFNAEWNIAAMIPWVTSIIVASSSITGWAEPGSNLIMQDPWFWAMLKGCKPFSSRVVNSAEQIISICTEEQQNTGLAQHSEDVEYCIVNVNKVSPWRFIPVHMESFILLNYEHNHGFFWSMPNNLITNSAYA